ncbi:alpha-L-rhamnosidase-related protein [Cohnella cholangitidis]|uniref:Bacterial alpha-L-rhamnosidase n=1 Tax=Cohnella cholangitidis TaxID=2598458 RepID=A0A7G5BWA1_9BACL|nr:alpha-L-rhamnosidase N-terminal domain-containing protein [Cohnella cholangitidis]QMV41235.1 Bacterial alpha-L-rhamnosidase [Cohnella cholangitidis]
MANKNWTAKWIWVREQDRGNNQYVEARKTFSLQTLPERSIVRITANQEYKLFVNGAEVGRGPSPCDNGSQYFDTYDVASRLKPGNNAIAITAYNFGDDVIVTGQRQGPGGLLCQLDLYSGFESALPERVLASDADWKCRVSPRWRSDSIRMHMWGGYREIYLANQEDGWERPEYDDSAWSSAVVVAEAEDAASTWPRLLAREIPPLKESLLRPLSLVGEQAYLGSIRNADYVLESMGGSAQPLAVDASAPGSYPQLTYDYGREVVGYPELTIEAPEGGVVHLFYGEGLEMELTDTFMLKKGENRLQPFGRRAFRYLKLAFQATPVPVTVTSLRMLFVHYPYQENGSFACSDDRLNRIWEVGKYTTVVNSQSHFEDCPHREGALWVADAVVMARVVYQTFGDKDIVRKSLLQSARIQNEDGSIPGTGPERNTFVLPDFCAHWLFGVKEYMEYSGDEEFLAEVWPSILRLADWFELQEDDDGLFAKADREGWWCFIDWSDDIERKDKVTAVSCYYYKMLKSVSELAICMGEPERAERLERKATALRAAIRGRMRTRDGVFADCLTGNGLSDSITAQTNFAAIWSGVMETEEAERFIRSYYLASKLPPIKGAFFYHIVLETLFAYPFSEEAIDEIRAFWGSMLDRGATTWWETFDPTLPASTVPSPYMGHTPTYMQAAIPVSFSHGWGASPTYLLTREVLGVDVSNLGAGRIDFRPSAVGELTWARGIVPTPIGEIEAAWARKDDGSYEFEATLPIDLQWTGEGLLDIQAVQEGENRKIKGTFEAQRKMLLH